jgi:hypothetical protein
MHKILYYSIIFSVLLFTSYQIHAQDPTISCIKVVNEVSDTVVSYPIFKFQNNVVTKQINEAVKKQLFYWIRDGDTTNIKAVLKEAIDSGNFEVVRYYPLKNDNDFLSFYVNAEEKSGQHHYFFDDDNFFLFDKRNGHLLSLDSLIAPNKKRSFLLMLKQNQQLFNTDYKKELRIEFKKGATDVDKESYKQALRGFNWSYDPTKFYVLNDRIVIIILCLQKWSGAPDVNFIPIYLKDIRQYMKPRFKNLLQPRRPAWQKQAEKVKEEIMSEF